MGRPRSINLIREYKNYAKVYTFNNYEFKISLSDVEKVSKYCWSGKKSNYGVYFYASKTIDGKESKIQLTRYLLEPEKHELIDHINRDTLDNRRENLRKVTRLQNNVNSKKRKNSVTKYKGVTKRPSGRFGCYIRYDNKNVCLGTFDTQELAAIEYNKKALEVFGKYALLNTIGEINE